MIKKLFNIILDFMYPHKCAFCDEILPKDVLVCDKCKGSLPNLDKSVCPACQREVCNCMQSYGIKGASIPFAYKDGVAKAIKLLKFDGITTNAPILAGYMFEDLSQRSFYDKIDCITYVPMHKRNLAQRGYNQSKLIAQEISRLSGKPLAEDVLLKIKFTKNQHKLNSEKRIKNLNKSIVFNKLSEYDIRGKSILICDDVFTTGATISACAKPLNENGVKSVFAACVARVE